MEEDISPTSLIRDLKIPWTRPRRTATGSKFARSWINLHKCHATWRPPPQLRRRQSSFWVRSIGKSGFRFSKSKSGFPNRTQNPKTDFTSKKVKDFQGGGGEHKPCTYGAGMAKAWWAGTPSYAKTTDLSGFIFFLALARRSLKNRHSIHYSSSCRGKHFDSRWFCHGHSHNPRWPHTWPYALHSLLRLTMTSDRLG